MTVPPLPRRTTGRYLLLYATSLILTALGGVQIEVAKAVPNGNDVIAVIELVDGDVVVVYTRSARVEAGKASLAGVIVAPASITGAFTAIPAVEGALRDVVTLGAEAVSWETKNTNQKQRISSKQ